MTEAGWIAEQQARFAGAIAHFKADTPALLISHNDADGLSAGAVLARAMARTGQPAPRVRLLGRGENAWSAELKASIDSDRVRPGGLLVADLGTRGDPVATGLRTVLIDHHVPNGSPLDPEADGITSPIAISGFGQDPVPTSSLLAWWCAGALCQADDLLWLACIGLIGDLGDKAPFELLAQARKRYGAMALREVTSLVNAPRRTASADASAAFALLMQAESPKDLLSGRHPGLDSLRAARDEVRKALEAGRRTAPIVRGDMAMIRLDTPCQIHPMVAQSWTGRLRGKIVLAANLGYRPGWVHFAARSGADVDLIDFLARHRPPGADEQYGNGHRAASGGALRIPDWNRFVAELGFGPEMEARS